MNPPTADRCQHADVSASGSGFCVGFLNTTRLSAARPSPEGTLLGPRGS